MSEDRMGNDATNVSIEQEREESFAELLERIDPAPEKLEPGRKVRARVVSVSGEYVYIDLGGKSEGVIDLREFMDEDGSVHVQEGGEVEAFFVTVQDGMRVLTTKVRGYSAVKLNAIRDAYDAGLPVNGEVRREVKGGFEVMVGGVRCFCPFSQIDLRGGREGGIYLGQTFPFRVIEFGEEGRNIIVSRRTVLEHERKERIERLRSTLAVGMDVQVTVRSIHNFGAFVDLGGVDGLIPASEMAWSRAERPSEVLSAGQKVTARIIALDWESNRLTLSLKALQPDPWAGIAERYPVDGRVNGTIVRLAPFGAFVNLEPGIDGLIHISNLGAGRRINHPREVVETGQTVEAYVREVDPGKRKISLTMQPRPKPVKVVLPKAGEILEGTVEKVMPYGVFVKIGNGLNGLVPNAEMGTPVGTDHERMFPAGSPMQVVVTEVDAAQAKVRLSRRQVMEKKDAEVFQEYRNSVKEREKTSGGFGSLGDILRAKLEEKNGRA